MALTIDEISALTEKLYVPLIADNVMNSNPVLSRLWQKGPKERGGTGIHAPLMYAKTTSAGAIRGFDAMTIDPGDEFTAAVWDWKEYYAAIVLSGRERLQNTGEPEILSHLSAKSQAAEMTLRDLLGTGLYSDGTSNPKLIDGLEAVVDDNNTYPNSGGGSVGIDRTVETWWQCGFRYATWTALGGGGPLSASTVFLGLQKGVGKLTQQPNSPTLIVGDQTLFDFAMAATEQYHRYEDEGMASMGFETILFRRIPIVVDSHATASMVYWLNENFLQLYTHQDENFKFSPFREPINQKAMVGFVFWTGNLVCNNSRFQGSVVNYAA